MTVDLDWVYVLTHGKYRSEVGDYVSPTVYISDDAAIKATHRALENAKGEFFRDEVAEDLGGDHVIEAYSNKEKTQTIWLERLDVAL